MTHERSEDVLLNHVVECGPARVDVDKRNRYGSVLGRSSRSLTWPFVLVVVLSLVLLAGPPAAIAAGDGQGPVGSLTDQITDTQNLLGANVGAVTDAINETQRKTGVHVRLLYLPSFYQGKNPDKWASQVLESTQPPANTVLLAVASKQGNLVVAVSSNSEGWLKEQSTVDDLSQAALKPIADSDSPDWVGSAEALMRQVEQSKRDHERRTILLWVALAGAVVVVVAAVVVAYLLKRRKGRKRVGRHSSRSGNVQSGTAS
ncbi:TPM domain-containing protein [Bifidobacterium xylocopae]|uniref:TPM domain-containing protein n=1 Tax=Bifidobacterium xylocopae TaxID=2493119 RepID=A0A366KFB9_9BIFI|nr:TPM domain-containing protein [Bifidobacterium xylocopae]RBP99952.1 hypothetical protein CRD59_00305 [Bifidobacterium xylocopae]